MKKRYIILAMVIPAVIVGGLLLQKSPSQILPEENSQKENITKPLEEPKRAPFVLAKDEVNITPGRSSIRFKTKHLIFSEVEGRFKNFEGAIHTPSECLTDAIFKARVDVKSIYTGIDDRDRHLIGKDFFDADTYPEILFESEQVVFTGVPHNFVVKGNLTMHGITLPVELLAKCQHKTLPNGQERVDLIATGQINRFDFGLKWNELMDTGSAIIDENVEIIIELAMLKAPK